MRITLLSVLLIFMGLNVFSQSDTENYVVTKTYQKETLTPIAEPTPEELLEVISYIDGLGRTKQVINRYGGGNQENLVTPMVYDTFGRQAKDYLPYARTTGDGSVVVDPLTEVSSFYNTVKYENTLNPFSEKQFEASPLNRIEKQAAPGLNWAMGSGHEIEFSNQSNATEDKVRLYLVEFPTGDTASSSLVIDADGFYGAGQLYKTITRDENHIGTTKNHTTEEFTDKQGRVILKRTYADFDTEWEAWHDTYYVYDDYGNLTYVLTPKMEASTATLASISGNMNALGYQYKYDYRNRLIEKRIPGKEQEFIIYNKLDQPVLSQDANQRLTNKWLYTKYDAFGRVVSTGIYTHASNVGQEAMQLQLDNHYVGSTPPKLYEEKSGMGYTNRSFPTTSTETLTENYFDDYNFDLAGLLIPSTISDGTTIKQDKSKGLATGSKVKVLETQDWITSISGYDKKGRTIWSGSKNTYLDTEDTSETILNFTGNILKSTTTHNKEGQVASIVVDDLYTYDHMGRMLKHTQSINGASEELIAENTYDELGQLIKKGVGNGNASNSLNEINTQTAFMDIAGITVDAEKGLLYRNGDVSYKGWDSGASTVEKLTGNGYFEFGSNASKHYAIGLSYDNIDHTAETMTYGIRGFNDRTIRIYENGVDQGVVFPDDGILRMVRENNIIKYYQKGTLLYTSPTPVTGDLLGDIALYSNGSTASVYNMHNEGEVDHVYEGFFKEINGMRVFDYGKMIKNSGSSQAANLKTFASFNGNGKIEFSRLWSSNGISVRLKSKKDSTYYLMEISSGTIKTGANGNKTFTGHAGIGDILSIERRDNKILYKNNGIQFSSEFAPSYDDLYAEVILGEHGSQIDSINVINEKDIVDFNRKTQFTNNYGVVVTETGGLVRDTSIPNGPQTGISTLNKIKGDGYFEFWPTYNNYSVAAGLSQQDTDYLYTSIEYALVTSVGSEYVSVFENGVNTGVNIIHEGAMFRVERSGNEILYKKNGVTFYISTKPATGDLIGDVSLISNNGVVANVQLYDYSLLTNYSSSANFEDIVNLVIGANESISKSKADGWNTDLATKKSILKSGELSFSPTYGNKELIAGLSYQNSIADPLTINYGIKLLIDGNVHVFEHGNDLGIKSTYTATDDFKIVRTGHEITYLKNEIIFYTSTSLAFHPLFGDLSIFSSGGGLNYLNLTETEAFNGYLQEIDYTYNIRGWLTKINDPSNLGEDLFGFEINYNKPTIAGATPLFNGNISETHWNSLSENLASNPISNQYLYNYDALNRITGAIDNTGNYSLNSIGYDKNGNITNLQRTGHIDEQVTTFGAMDDLVYDYGTVNGNQLMSVADNSLKTTGFKDGNTAGDDYAYDANGNMTSDLNKGIQTNGIIYNHLNLPTSVTLAGGTISYIYDATGVKQRKVATGTTTDYAGNYIYQNGSLEFFNHPEGYVEYDSGSFNYVYNYTDHLGNVRLSYSDLNGDGSITPSIEILKERNYYPFGLEHKGYNNVVKGTENKHKTYNGKELNEELGLNWLDYGARNYDAALGRFFSMDKFTEKFEHMSPYQYAANTPTLFIDKNGEYIYMYVYYQNKNGKTRSREIRYNNKDDKFYYHGGKLKGQEYTGSSAIVASVKSALGDLKSGGNTGKSLVSFFADNKSEGLRIAKGSKNFATSDGNTISFAPGVRKGGLDVNGDNDRSPFIGLGHELAHAQDTWQGLIDSSEWFNVTAKGGEKKSVPKAEIYATFIENLIREENNVPLRQYYTTSKYSDAKILQKGALGGYYNVNSSFILNRTKQQLKNIFSKVITVIPNKTK